MVSKTKTKQKNTGQSIFNHPLFRPIVVLVIIAVTLGIALLSSHNVPRSDPKIVADKTLAAIYHSCSLEQTNVYFPLTGETIEKYLKNDCHPDQTTYKFIRRLDKPAPTAAELKADTNSEDNAGLEYSITEKNTQNKIMVYLVWDKDVKDWRVFSISLTSLNTPK